MRPSRYFFITVCLWLSFACITGLVRIFAFDEVQLFVQLFWLLGFILTLTISIDWYFGRRTPKLEIQRNLTSGFSMGVNNPFSLFIHNQAQRPLFIQLKEKTPDSLRILGMPSHLNLQAGETVKLALIAYPTVRGTFSFSGLDTFIQSKLRFWQHRATFLKPVDVRVFPNFKAVSNFELLTHGHSVSQVGIHLNQRRGEGLDFHQLREFRPGDSLRQVDWKATSRTLKPISREFQDERDQDIIFLIDSGRRMRAKDGELSHFDHCLNALLLTSYVALKQGDAVGFHSFGNANRWVAPVKGKHNLTTLLHQVYDLHSSTATSDYLLAAQSLLDKHTKRSLVVLISNIDSQDNDDLLSAYSLLSKNHLVMFACLQETTINEATEQLVNDFDQALIYTSAIEHQNLRKATIRQLICAGAIVIDKPASQMHTALVNEYYALKRSGRI